MPRTITYRNPAPRRKRRFPTGVVIGALVALAIVVGLVFVGIAYNHESTVTLTVKKTYIALTGHSGEIKHQFRVITTHDGKEETFRMTDTILHGRVNTADQYALLDAGKTYECKTYGWRIPLLSHFRNLFDCHPA